MQKFEHFGAKIKNRPKSSLRTFLHGALQLYINYRRTNYRKFSLKKLGEHKIWNKLPKELRNHNHIILLRNYQEIIYKIKCNT